MNPDLLLIGDITARMRDRLDGEFTVHLLPPATERAAFLAAVGPRIRAVATYSGAGLPVDVMSALPNLQIISSYGVGYDSIDAAGAAARGIVVTNTPDVLNDDVANTAILLWFATARRLVANDSYVRAGRWQRDGAPPLTRTTQNQKVGILGLGRIGMAIADRLAVFGADIAYHTRSPKDVAYTYYDTLSDMAQAVDVLICITPGGPGTRHLVDAQVLAALGPDGILVNVARGTVVDQAALVSALQDGTLGGAGLDVFEDEPHVPAALMAMDNVTLQPHVGSATVETRRAMGDLTCANLSQFYRDGTVLTPVPECSAFARVAKA